MNNEWRSQQERDECVREDQSIHAGEIINTARIHPGSSDLDNVAENLHKMTKTGKPNRPQRQSRVKRLWLTS